MFLQFNPQCPDVFIREKVTTLYPNWAMRFDKAAACLQNSQLSRGLNLEKLESNLYSIRISLKARMLVVSYSGRWFFLEFLENHEYDKSQFLQDKLSLQTINLELAKWQPENNNVVATAPVVTVENQELELSYFNQQYLILNPAQKEIVKTKLPLLVTGNPGTGKSALLFSLIEQIKQDAYFQKNPVKLGVICDSEILANKFNSMYQESPINLDFFENTKEESYFTIEFLSYKSALKKQTALDLSDNGFELFDEWLAQPNSHSSSLLKKIASGIPTTDNFSFSIYQEFRLLSGIEPEIYASNFNNHLSLEIKENFLKLYQRYLNYLQNNKLKDAAFQRWPETESLGFTHLLVDELCDLSTLQIKQLVQQLSDNANVFVAADGNQSLTDNASKINFLKYLLPNLSHFYLQESLRCARSIVELAQRVLDLKHHITKGKMDKYTSNIISAPSNAESGTIEWIESISEALQTEANNSIRIAVICSPENKAQALLEFCSSIVLTVEEAKGLEFDKVIIYQWLNPVKLKKYNPLLENFQSTDKKVGRALRGGDISDHTEFNKLFVALSRAKTHLIIYQKPEPSIRHIYKFLKTTSVSEKSEYFVPSTQKEWEQKINQLQEITDTKVLRKAHLINCTESKNLVAVKSTLPANDCNSTPVVKTPQKKNEVQKSSNPGTSISNLNKSENARILTPKEAKKAFINSFIKTKLTQSSMLQLLAHEDFKNLLLKTRFNSVFSELHGWLIVQKNFKTIFNEIVKNYIQDNRYKENIFFILQITVDYHSKYIEQLLTIPFTEGIILNLLASNIRQQILNKTIDKKNTVLQKELFKNKNFIKVLNGILYNYAQFKSADNGIDSFLTPTLWTSLDKASLLHWLLEHEKPFFKKNNAIICELFSLEKLTQSIDTPEYKNIPMFIYLLLHPAGKEFLSFIIENDPTGIEKIDLSLLNYNMINWIHWLARSYLNLPGKTLLLEYFVQCNPKIVSLINYQDLTAEPHANSFLFTGSLLTVLKQSVEKSVLKNLFLDMRLAQCLTPSDLFTVFDTKNSRNESLFLWFCEDFAGSLILDRLLKSKTHSLQEISIYTLLLGPSDFNDDIQKKSAFYLLCNSNLSILNSIFKLQPDLFKDLSLNYFLTIPEGANKNILQILFEEFDGYNFLELLIDNHPLLFKGLTLNQLFSVSEKETVPSLLKIFDLLQSNEGLRFLNKLITQDSTLIKELTANILCAPLPDMDSMFYHLTVCIDGLELLETLIKHSNFASDLKSESLYSHFSGTFFDDGDEINYKKTSPFSNLTSSEKGRELLLLIFKKNSAFIHAIDEDILFSLHIYIDQIQSQAPVFFSIIDVVGDEILNLIANTNPDIGAKIANYKKHSLVNSTSFFGSNLQPKKTLKESEFVLSSSNLSGPHK